jgi:hypothetical protein
MVGIITIRYVLDGKCGLELELELRFGAGHTKKDEEKKNSVCSSARNFSVLELRGLCVEVVDDHQL